MHIDEFCKEFKLGNVLQVDKLTGGLMHKMFKVETDKGVYAIKVLNPEVMSRDDAYNNFVVSETISNLAKENGIPVSNALKINGDFLIKFNDSYHMVFDFVEGKTLKDDEIDIEHCKKIGKILSLIHSLKYEGLGLDTEIIEYKRLYDWESYIKNSNFDKMSYKGLFLKNYKKYNSMLKRANERFNASNTKLTICHRDMDPKNVMWNGHEPLVIDWESASLANPYRELVEDALCWSGFLSNNFSEEKFVAVIESYSLDNDISEVDWYDVICGNLVGRFGWLKYNLERSLGIKSDDVEEKKLAENEVSKTIDEINRYLELIGTMYDVFCKLSCKDENNYDQVIEKIILNNTVLSDSSYKLITAGFTNTIYSVGNYVVRICTDLKNEDRFKNEIEFYNENKDNDMIPSLYVGDTSKKYVPYYYEVMEKVNGVTLYEVWYKLGSAERKSVVNEIVKILKAFHSIEVESYDFCDFIKKKLMKVIEESKLDSNLFLDLFNKCNQYFADNKFGLIHGDLHFDNFIYDNSEVKLLDFERSMIAPIDYEFRIFAIYDSEPWLWASAKTDMLTVEEDYKDLMEMFVKEYMELRNVSYLKQRLTIYEIIELLNNYKNTHNGEKLEKVMEKMRTL